MGGVYVTASDYITRSTRPSHFFSCTLKNMGRPVGTRLNLDVDPCLTNSPHRDKPSGLDGHATYSAGSISESDSLVDQCLGLMLKG